MRPNKPWNLCVLSAVAAFLGSSRLLAQVADLPIKPGLWEANVNVKSGASNIDSGPEQVCFTAGMTLGEYIAATNHGASGTKCDVTNRIVTPQEISYDTVCSGPHTDAKGHVDFHLIDPAHFNGTSHMTSTGKAQGKSLAITLDKTFSAKFLSASCGSVKPMAVPTSHGG
jgi:hypothetical protein